MSSARIDPPKRVLGLKEVVVTPPLNHGSFHKVGLESNSTGSSFPADSAKPVPLAVVSLDSIQGQNHIALASARTIAMLSFNLTVGFPLSVPVLSWLFDARGKIPKEPFPVRPPADTRRSALATSAAEASRQQLTGDQKYSENLRSTIEEHRPCHFRSSTIGGVTKVIVMGSYLTVIFHSRSTETSLNGWTVLTDVSIIRLEFATLMREIWDIIDTSNTSPDSCVIDVKVGVVYGSIQSDATAHDHLDALILPASQVSSLC
ncbi:hypothetical protein YC2023_072169 [Brassica napus]